MRRVLRNAIKALRPNARTDLENALRCMVRHAATRYILNGIYDQLSLKNKHIFYRSFKELFYGHDASFKACFWEVRVPTEKIRLPLGHKDTPLEWEQALSCLGHDAEMRDFYFALLRTSSRPNVMLDVGANYGLHSLIMLKNRCRVISFEPNTSCHEYFITTCQLNNLKSDVQPYALGDELREIDMWYPQNATWLGTIVPGVRDELEKQHTLTRIKVRQSTIDDYVREANTLPDIIKIDTEGNELQVLRGAKHLLRDHSPIVLFESWTYSQREQLFDELSFSKYGLWTLDYMQCLANDPLKRAEFLNEKKMNFLAIPAVKFQLIDELHSARS